MQRIITSVILSMLAAGCVFADTAKIEAFVIDETTERPLANVEVTGCFSMNYGWLAVKGRSGPNICKATTDASGRCKLSGKTNVGSAGCYVHQAPSGYYAHSGGGGYDFKTKNMLGIWQPDNLVVTVRLQRVEHPIPLFVKRVGKILPGLAKDIFPEGKDTLKFDMMKGEYLPPVGKGEVADVEFRRLPREELGEGVNFGGDKGRAYRDSMEVKFLGEGNGLVEMSYPATARLKIRTAPETGYKQDYLCWGGVNKQLRHEKSFNEDRCFCFRIRTRKNEKGEIVEAYYGKIYRDISFSGEYHEGKPIAPVSAVNFLYYLNPTSLDRNLEWNKQNLCKEPIYPRPDCRNLEWEYESFNRNLKP